MSDIEEIFSENAETETQDENESLSKREFLIGVINQGKADKLPGKTPWTVCRINKASDVVIEKLYNDYHQNEIKHKAETTGKAVSKHMVNLYSNGVSRLLKIDNIELLRKDIDEDPIIKDSMADIGALMMTTFGKFMTPLLLVAHTANHTEGFVETEKIDEKTTIINE